MVKQWWDNLSERDKNFSIAGSALLGLYLLYSFVIAPFNSTVNNAKQAMIDKKETLAFMQNVLAHTPPGETAEQITNNELLSLLSKSLQQTSFQSYTYQLGQTSSGDIELAYNTVPFMPFLEWLNKICEKYTVNIKRLSVNKTKTSGVVKLSLVIGASG